MFFKKLIRFHSYLLHSSKNFYDILLAPICILCGLHSQNSLNFCYPCLKDLPILPHTCPQCAQFLPKVTGRICGTCLKKPPPFDVTHALFPYEPPIIQLIIRLKFFHQLSHAKAFGQLLSDKIFNQWYKEKPLPDLIIPIPLHPKRLRERGFNQALEIAKPTAQSLKLPLDYNGIIRIKSTSAQSGLLATERKRNMENAFSSTRDYSGKHVAVIDDVITTGHTMLEFCRTLKENGAKQIDVWCCARRIQ